MTSPLRFAIKAGRGAGVSNEEDMIEHAMRVLLSDQQNARHLVWALVTQWTQVPPLQLVYVLSITAGTIEEMLAEPEHRALAQEVWRMAGLVGVDLWMMQQMDLPATDLRDVMAYWLVHDRFFLP